MREARTTIRRLIGGRRRDRSGGPPPNILFFMTDQQRWDSLGCTGGWVETPNVDRLAREGVLFPNAYTNAPVCVPARVSLAVGKYPHNHGVWRNAKYTLPADAPTWMRALRDAGYSTSVFGKTHLHPQSGDLREREDLVRAWGLDTVDELAGPRASMACRTNLRDRWEEAGVWDAYRDDLRDRFEHKPWVARPSPLPLELYPDVYVGSRAASHLRAHDDGRPWFCWVSFPGPHEPWDAPEPYASRYDPAAMPAPLPRPVEDHERPHGVLDEKLGKNPIAFEPGDVERLRANYAGKVTLIDDQVGEVLRVVEERGELERTAVVFVSDHGEMNGDYGLLYKGTFLNPAARVPFVLRAPELASGAVAEAPVELMDAGATLVELAGARPLRGSHAKSLVPVLEAPALAQREVTLSELRREVMLATDRWKLVQNREGAPYLLFDLEEDPNETRNLAGLPEHAETERDLQRRLADAVAAAG